MNRHADLIGLNDIIVLRNDSEIDRTFCQINGVGIDIGHDGICYM